MAQKHGLEGLAVLLGENDVDVDILPDLTDQDRERLVCRSASAADCIGFYLAQLLRLRHDCLARLFPNTFDNR
jgi:hypothetical protein